MTAALPTIKYLRECFDLRQDGSLVWRVRPRKHFASAAAQRTINSRHAGKTAGSQPLKGYSKVALRGRLVSAHRIVWALAYGRWPTHRIDHVNGECRDNRVSNLRPANQSQNSQNRRMRSDNTSGVKGVSWSSRRRKWVATIMTEGRTLYLGGFQNLKDACEAVTTARGIAHGTFCNHG